VSAPTTIYLGLGSNLGDRKRNLIGAIERLAPDVRVDGVSSLYETDPVGPPGQQDYCNAVCRAATKLEPLELLAHVKRIERDMGRTEGERWGPREIDIDILLYGERQVVEENLEIPHREMTMRGFVLVPLAELAADVVHPTTGRTINDLVADADASGVRLLEERGWEA
jgi:2-amino-4-hydroxy-6-hydroxymethyldihydropteridine diphosphokinase